ncbi:MAG: hypothetical protein NC399_01760 [Muribaculum sp.]|nr:hypothetical protein [Muribaculum sp.]
MEKDCFNRKWMQRRIRRCVGVCALSACVWLASCGNEAGKTEAPVERTIAQTLPPQTEPPRSAAVYDKEETVYADATATGEVYAVTVETRLKSAEGGSLEDRTVLSEIRNMEGDEGYRLGADGSLIWENSGADIRYEGKSGEPLPVTVRICYELDGRSVTPEELAGQSGRLRMRIDYENHRREQINIEGERLEVCVPFAAFSMILLPKDVFSDVQVTNGKLMSLGEERLAVGYAYPGLADSLRLAEYEELGKEIEIPDYMEITAQVTDFALEFTATVISTGTFEDMNTEGLDDVEELIDSMEELKEASGKLVEGCRELTDGVGEFGNYLSEYVDAVGAVKEGTAALQQGIGTLDSGKKSILKGAEALQAGLEALQAAVSGAAAPQGQEGEDGGENTGGEDKTEEAPDIRVILADMETRLAALEGAAGGDAQMQEQITALRADIQALEACMSAMETASAASMKQMADSVAQLAEGSAKLTEGIKTFNKGIGKLYEGAESLNDGVGELKEAGTKLQNGYQELTDGVETFADGVKKFDKEGIQELAELADEDLENLVKRLRAVKEADGRYINYGGILPGKTGSVQFIIETEEIK